MIACQDADGLMDLFNLLSLFNNNNISVLLMVEHKNNMSKLQKVTTPNYIIGEPKLRAQPAQCSRNLMAVLCCSRYPMSHRGDLSSISIGRALLEYV